jgi:hypothetical protein
MNLNHLPVAIKRSMSTADLPSNYENAKRALSACIQLDECREWANRMAAIASYAKQAKDKSLEDLASRIRLRAVRRLGELLAEVPSAPRGRGPKNERKEAADRIGMTLADASRAVRIASISEPEFEQKISTTPVPTLRQIDPGWTIALAKKVSGDATQLNAYVELQAALGPLLRMVFDERVDAKELAARIKAVGMPREYINGLKLGALAVSEWLDSLEQQL